MFDVVMPTYNNIPEFLDEALISILQQTHPQWHLYICDASDDDRVERALARVGLTKYTILRQCGYGYSQAMNQAIAAGSGEYVAFLDADDIWSEDRLEVTKDAISTENPPILFGYSQIIQSLKGRKGYITGRATPSRNYPRWKETRPEDWWIRVAAKPVCMATLTIRRDIAEEYVFEEHDYAADTDMLIRILKDHEPTIIPHTIGTYRIHQAQTTSSGQTTQNTTKRGNIFSAEEKAHILRLLKGCDDYSKEFCKVTRLHEQFDWIFDSSSEGFI